MSNPTRYIKLAFLDLSEADQRPLKSIIGMTTRVLNMEYDWTVPAESDICIVDVHGQSPFPENAVAIRFSSRRNGIPVDLARPVHARDLLSALERALGQVQQKEQKFKRTAVGLKRYRGAIVE